MTDLKQARINHKKIKRDKELYKFRESDDKLHRVEIVDQEYQGRLISDYLDELRQYRETFYKIKQHMSKNGTKFVSKEISELYDVIVNSLIIYPEKSYTSITFDDSGYILTKNDITGTIIKNSQLPKNLTNGCYYLEGKTIKLDSKKLKLNMEEV